MCGVAGILSPAGVEEAEVRPLVDRERHRGPDGWGTWSDGLCVLGHRRLAVIDLSDRARQPMANPAGTVHLVYNGEIYNYVALREELQRAGHRFRSESDTEVILAAYDEWDTGALARFRGMFAFGLWDARRRRLILARDRVGKKPLFYAVVGDRLLFASELQALLAHSSVARTPDLAAVDAYLSWGYVAAPSTGFNGVFAVEPAHCVVVDCAASDLSVRSTRYWALPYAPKVSCTFDEAAKVLREKLEIAVRLRMRSDVPIGAFLSGGIDSSVVVGLMARESSRPVQTFTIGFDEAAYSELPFARPVAARWKTDHHELIVRPDALAVLPALVRHYGSPFADSSAIPTFYLSQMTRASVTVALSGDGGDESFAGYERYRALRFAESLRRVPAGAAAAGAMARVLPDSVDGGNRLRRAKRFLAAVRLPLADRYAHWIQYFDIARKEALYGPALRPWLARGPAPWDDVFSPAGGLDPVDGAMKADVGAYLPGDLLVKVDIASMANSLEVRAPFLDHEVMEFAATLPVDFKLRGNQSKAILKHACADLLEPVTAGRGKMGFGVPVGEWLRGPLRDLLHDAILSPRSLARGLFEPSAVATLVRQHVDGRARHSSQLWALLMLELWYREFIDAPPGAR